MKLLPLRRSVIVLGLILTLALVATLGIRELLQPYPTRSFQIPVTIDGHRQGVQVEWFGQDWNVVEQRPAIVLLHGVEGPHNFWRERYQTAANLARQGYQVFIVHYMNGMPYDDLYLYDKSGKLDIPTIDSQRIQDDERWVQTVKHVFHHIAQRPDVDPRRIALYGNSLGGFLSLAVAAEMARERAALCPACLVINWGAVWSETSIPVGFPKTLFVHGECDQIVEPKWAHYSIGKIREMNGEAELFLVPGAPHIAQSPESDAAIDKFLAANLQ